MMTHSLLPHHLTYQSRGIQLAHRLVSRQRHQGHHHHHFILTNCDYLIKFNLNLFLFFIVQGKFDESFGSEFVFGTLEIGTSNLR